MHNFPAQQLALGLQQHKSTLLQVPHAQLQAMSNVGGTVQGVASVLPFFQTSHAATAPGLCLLCSTSLLCSAAPLHSSPRWCGHIEAHVRLRVSLSVLCGPDAQSPWLPLRVELSW
jgi:hypothetical protein